MDVTVVEAYVNSDYFQGKNTPVYPYIGAGSGTTRMQWSGDTANALGTYGGVNTIIAQQNLLFDGTYLHTGASGINIGGPSLGTRFANISREADGSLSHTQLIHSNTAGIGNRGDIVYRSGGSGGSISAAPTNAVIQKDTYYVHDGSGYEAGAEVIIEIDGVVATGDFDVNMSWALKDGAASMAIMMSLYPDLFTLVPPVRLSNLGGGGDGIVMTDNDGDLTASADIVVDSINFGDSVSNISLDSAGNMVFTDDVGGPYELSELVSGGTSISATTLVDNDTTYVVVGDSAQDRSIHLMYTIVRDTSYQEGIIKILYDGSDVYILDDFQDNGVGSGVVFTAEIDSAGYINLVATTTSTGEDATFKATVKRIMI